MGDPSLPLIVSRSADGLTVHVRFGSSGDINTERRTFVPTSTIERSELLHDIFCGDIEEVSEIPIAGSLLQGWLDFVVRDPAELATDWTKQQLKEVLQAADFLRDREGVSSLCHVLATRFKQDLGLSSSDRDMEHGGDKQWESAVQVLESLHSSLVLAILRDIAGKAINSSTRDKSYRLIPFEVDDSLIEAMPQDTELYQARMSSRPIPDEDSAKSELIAGFLRSLPPHLHHLAVEALWPTIKTEGSLALRLAHDVDARTVAISAAKSQPTLTSLRFEGGQFGSARQLSALDQDSHLSRLSSLQFSRCLGEFIDGVLGSMQLPPLTYLRIEPVPKRKWSHSTFQALSSLQSLQVLDISTCAPDEWATVSSDCLIHLVASLQQMSCLRELDISGNDVGDDGFQILNPALVQLPLKILRAARCVVSKESGSEESREHSGGPFIPEHGLLQLQQVVADGECMLPLARRQSFSTQLRHLSLHGDFGSSCHSIQCLLEKDISLDSFGIDVEVTGSDEEATESVMQHLGNGLAKWTELQHLRLFMNPDVSGSGVHRMAAHLAKLSNLQVLILMVGHEHLQLFLHAAPTLTGMKEFSIALDTAEDSALVAPLLQQMPTLEAFSLYGDESLFLTRSIEAGPLHDEVAAALPVLTHLTRIVLIDVVRGGNAQAFAESIKALQGLRRAALGNHSKSPACFLQLLPALQCLTALERLDMGQLNFEDEDLGKLERGLASMRSLREVCCEELHEWCSSRSCA